MLLLFTLYLFVWIYYITSGENLQGEEAKRWQKTLTKLWDVARFL